MQKLILVLPTILGVLTLSFFLIHLIPGDPVDYVLGEQAELGDKQKLRQELGLDQPLNQQFKIYLEKMVRFNWGQSLHSKQPVLTEVIARFQATVELAIAALSLALLWGLPLGVWAATRPYSWRDHLCAGVSLLGMSVPGVFLGPMLVYLFAMQLGWFPVSERAGWEHLLLPALSLAIPLGAVILRMTRAAMLEVISEDYIRTARAKGVTERRIFFVHALRNALMPIITIVGLQLGALMTGTVITETIFDWPGLGTLLFQSIQRRDYPVVQGTILFIACLYVLVNLLTDLCYGLVNPRVRST